MTSGSADTDQTVPGAIVQLSRLQDIQMSMNYPLEQTMYLNGGNESYLLTNNSISLSMKWLHTNGRNEQLVGLMDLIPPSGTPGFNLGQEKNVYITVENTPGLDAIGASGSKQSKTVIGIGQALLTQYQISAQIGGIIASQASLDCLTSFVYTGNSGNQVPSVDHKNGTQMTGLFILPAASAQYQINNPQNLYSTGSLDYISAISSNDMVLTFPVNSPFAVIFTGQQSCYLQSFNCGLTFNRRETKSMGYAFPSKRDILYPISVNLTTDAIVSSYQADQLQRIGCLSTGFYINLFVKQPCSNAVLFSLCFEELQISSQSFGSSIGSKDTVSINWKGIISNPYQTFFNPTIGFLYDTTLTGAWGLHW